MQTPDAVGAGRNSNCGFSPTTGNEGAQESCAVPGIAQTGRVTRSGKRLDGRRRFFKWDFKTQTVDEMDTLQPLHVTELARPG
jgi:hypothetical protein